MWLRSAEHSHVAAAPQKRSVQTQRARADEWRDYLLSVVVRGNSVIAGTGAQSRASVTPALAQHAAVAAVAACIDAAVARDTYAIDATARSVCVVRRQSHAWLHTGPLWTH